MIEVRMQFQSIDELIATLGHKPVGEIHAVEPAPAVAAAPQFADEEHAALLAKARELGVKVRSNASVDTIRQRIEAATASAAAPKAEEPKRDAVEKTAQETTEPADSVTADDAKQALMDVNAKHGMARAIAVLKEFGASRVSELPEGEWQQFVARCAEVCNESA